MPDPSSAPTLTALRAEHPDLDARLLELDPYESINALTKGTVDINGIVGYYTFLAMQLNAAQYAIPADAKKLPRLPR